MGKPTRRGLEIRAFVLAGVEDHSGDIVHMAAERFDVSHRAIAWHLRKLVDKGLLSTAGKARAKTYHLRTVGSEDHIMSVGPELEEHVVWREKVLPHLDEVPENVLGICEYGFQEIFNNVIEHSQADLVVVRVAMNAIKVIIQVTDDGVGIFSKIKEEFGLDEPKHALLEISKGKLTTDQEGHLGEGVFYTSHMFDKFSVLSGELAYHRKYQRDEWINRVADIEPITGTVFNMEISLHSERTVRQIHRQFETGVNRDFSRTHVPITLNRYATEQLISRSHARRVLARLERFTEVMLDFQGVDEIGRAFADEIFRVYQRKHPDLKILAFNATPEVSQTIRGVTPD